MPSPVVGPLPGLAGRRSFVSQGRTGLLSRTASWAARRYLGQAPLRFTLADGSVLSPPGGEAVATVVFRSPLAALQVLRDPEVRFGEAYVRGDVSVDGDLVRALEETYRLRQEGARAAAGEEARPRRDAASNVRRHYDLGNDFYRLWLDERMLYTCAYFPSPEATLEEAQVAKMERVCRKLDLRPGERVVEAGCGWGAFALHMARHHGVAVTAYNLSREQIRFARERAGAEGLRDKVEFVEDDYRRIDGRFDAFVSLGMLEHVGVKSYGALGALLDRCLDPVHGRGLLHFIGQDQPTPLNPWIRRFIFPGAYPPTVGQALRGVLEGKAWSVLDVENLRAHYALTLRHWRTRFEAHADEVTASLGPAFTRRWRLYLAGSEAAFRTGALELFQVVFGRRGHDDLPWARVAS